MDKQDWKGGGGKDSAFGLIGTRGEQPRAGRDYYATDPAAAEWLLRIEDIPKGKPIWEPACGELHLSRVFERHGYYVRNSDIIARCGGIEEYDFLTPEMFAGSRDSFDGTIITNPPYRYAQEFIVRAIETAADWNKVCMFLPLRFLETKGRQKLFSDYPPVRVWVSSGRLACARNGDFAKYGGNGAVTYAWFVWVKGWRGETIVKWFNY